MSPACPATRSITTPPRANEATNIAQAAEPPTLAEAIAVVNAAGVHPPVQRRKSHTRPMKQHGRHKPTVKEQRERVLQLLMGIPLKDKKAIAAQLIKSAKAGDAWAIQQYLDRVLGKPAQAVEIKAEEGYLPLVVGMPPGVEDVVEGEVVRTADNYTDPGLPSPSAQTQTEGESPDAAPHAY